MLLEPPSKILIPGPGHKNGLEEKTYLAMDSPVHGEPGGVNCILVEDCPHKL